MGIKISEGEVQFQNIGVTDYFIYEGQLIMKTQPLLVEDEEKNAVSLLDGDYWAFDEWVNVKRVEIEMSAKFILNKD